MITENHLRGEAECEWATACMRVKDSGEILLVEDVTDKGHKSQSVDGKTRHSLFIPVE
jgi:hypothetical protein